MVIFGGYNDRGFTKPDISYFEINKIKVSSLLLSKEAHKCKI